MRVGVERVERVERVESYYYPRNRKRWAGK